MAVNVTDHTVRGLQYPEPNDFPPPQVIYTSAYASIRVLASGLLRGVASLSSSEGNTNIDYSGEWLASGSAASVDVRATLLSGSTPTGTLGAWMNCSADRTWSIDHSGPGGSTAVLLLEFCVAGTNGADMLDSCQITLEASRT